MVDAPLPDSELERLLLALLRLAGPAPGSAADPAAGPAPGSAADPAAGPAAGSAAGPAGGDRPAISDAPAIPALSSSEARALIELGAAHGIAQGELAGLLGLEKSTVSRLAVGLEHKGWIRRGRDQGDQRYIRLYLTAEGAAVARQVWRAWQTRQARILAGLSAEERRGLAAGLRGLVRGLSAEGAAGARPAEPLGARREDPLSAQASGHAVRI